MRKVQAKTAMAVRTKAGLLSMRAHRVYTVDPDVAKRLVGAGVVSYVDAAPAPAPAPAPKPVAEEKPAEKPVVEEKPKPVRKPVKKPEV